MNREMFARGRKIAKRIAYQIKNNQLKGTFATLFYNQNDYKRAHAMLEIPEVMCESWEDYRDKLCGALSFLTDTDGILFVDMIRCLDAGGLDAARQEIHAPGGEHLNPAMLAPFFGLKFPDHVRKPSEVKL